MTLRLLTCKMPQSMPEGILGLVVLSVWIVRCNAALITQRSQVQILPPLPCDLSGHRNDPGPTLGSGVFRLAGWSGWPAGGLVVAAGIQGELAE